MAYMDHNQDLKPGTPEYARYNGTLIMLYNFFGQFAEFYYIHYKTWTMDKSAPFFKKLMFVECLYRGSKHLDEEVTKIQNYDKIVYIIPVIEQKLIHYLDILPK